jgi:hypothetical protein
MIQANELRIGNWIDDVKPQNLALPQHSYFQVKWEHIAKAEAKWEYRPIPLTPEILEKAGFEYGKTGKKKDGEFVEFWDIRTKEHKHSFGTFIFSVVRWQDALTKKMGEFTFSHHTIRSDCKYVHQLQNLYFALTSQELPIDLTS